MSGATEPEEGSGILVKRLGLSPEACDRLETLRAILTEWNDRMNLVGPQELTRYWTRHALDSAQLVALAPASATRWLDLGSGAGFPGLVIAACIADRQSALVDLVEKSPKKCQFLRAAAEAMGVPARVLPIRAEDAPDAPHHVITARAFAPLPRLIEHAKRYLARGAIGLFPKGGDFRNELTAAGFTPVGGAFVQGSMRVEALESISNPQARVLRIQLVG